MPILVEADVIDDAGVVRTLRLSTGAHVTRPGEVLANATYEPRLIEPGAYSCSLWRPGELSGRSEVGYGAIIAAGGDGVFDWMVAGDCGVDGRALTIRRGPRRGRYPEDFPVIFQGTMEDFALSRGRLKLMIRDRQAELAERALQPLKFTGDDAVDGVEGGPELKDRPKPLAWGRCSNVSLVRVNRYRDIWMASSTAASVWPVRDGGVPYGVGVARVTLAALIATSPAPGLCDWYYGPEGSFVRLGTPPSRTVTADVVEGASALDRSAPRIMRRIMLGPGELIAADVDDSSVDAAHAAAAGECGLWLASGGEVGQALDDLAASFGGWWVPDRFGRFRVGQLAAPTGDPVAEIEAWQILGDGPELLALGRRPGGLPTAKITVNWGRCWTVQGVTDLLGDPASPSDPIGAAWRGYVGREWRPAVAEPAGVRIRHPLAHDLTVDSLLVEEADAQAEAARLGALWGTRRPVARWSMAATQADAIDRGAVIRLRTPRFGFGAGKLLRVTRRDDELRSNLTTLEALG
ncbi:MAG: hypothetical protein HQL40_12610 [Alphaproteobacteria bacterium]|nr:hypothetical protein [Alphaproteobacteria bacterium]